MEDGLNKIEDIQFGLYINLKAREDRREYVENQFNRLSLNDTFNIQRFDAVSLSNPSIGCAMSHLKCIEHAREKGWDHILICEDDITFLNPAVFKNNLQHFLKRNKEWDVLLLGGNNAGTFVQENPYSCRIFACQTTTGYIVKSHYYNTLIDNIKDGIGLLMRNPMQPTLYSIDRYWFSLQAIHQWYIITPLTVIQKENDYSDIEQKVVNYRNMMMCMDKSKWLLMK